MKKVIVVGASGVLGGAVAAGLDKDHDVIRASRNGADLAVDASNVEQLDAAFKKVGPIDGLVVCIGHVPFEPFESVNLDAFAAGIMNKFMHQANLVRAALPYLNNNAAVVLTSGILADEPLIGSSCAAAANGALHSFVMALSGELAGRVRVNVVSPSVVEASVEGYGNFFDGFEATSMDSLVKGYRRCLAGPFTGRVLKI
ncbi:MAG: short chain dehydrogenase [Sneathiella sp.]|nr:short chain dehydrogenase [Sneathiella sp.]